MYSWVCCPPQVLCAVCMMLLDALLDALVVEEVAAE